MDITEIISLFNDQMKIKKYLKKDYIKTYPESQNAGATHVVFRCHALTDKLIDYSDSYFLFRGYLTAAAGDVIGLQNGSNCLFKDVKLSFNNNEVEHNRRPYLSTTWLNLLEFSPDYAGSIAVQHGFIKDKTLGGGDNAGLTGRIDVSNGDHVANNGYPITVKVPLKYLSQFARRLTFPIMNQLFQIEMDINDHNLAILRDGAQASQISLQSIEFIAPEVVLPTSENNKLMSALASNNFTKELSWDAADFVLEGTQVQANQQFDVLLGTNLPGVQKLLFMVHAHVNDQEYVQTASDISITNFNVQIDSKDLYNMLVSTDQEAYELVTQNFNAGGKDYNTGSLLPYTDWKSTYRLYALDLSRQEVFEGDPNKVQQIRLRGTASANGTLLIILMKNKKTHIDFANPQNTKTV